MVFNQTEKQERSYFAANNQSVEADNQPYRCVRERPCRYIWRSTKTTFWSSKDIDPHEIRSMRESILNHFCHRRKCNCKRRRFAKIVDIPYFGRIDFSREEREL